MIAYDLRCSKAHSFEGWFASSGDYEMQMLNGQLRCPVCNDAIVIKQLTPPNLGRKTNQSGFKAPQLESPAMPLPETPVPTISDAIPITHTPAIMTEVIEKLAKVQSEILKDSRWVGRKFADEARAIHYGEVQPQQIHGEASPQEAQALAEEGVAIAALPLPFIPPESKN